MSLPAFHLAIPVVDLEACLVFYRDLLGCQEGRRSADWADLSLRGHQLVLHRVPAGQPAARSPASNPVDGDRVPVPHFGLVLPWQEWERLGDRIRAAGHPFRIEPRVRFAGQVGEQGTFFLLDPSANALEFKALRDPEQLFAS